MKYIADLHIHSPYSRGTSRDLQLILLHRWAQLKGVHILSTGDVLHPQWLGKLEKQLQPAPEAGLYQLKEDYQADDVPPSCRGEVRFILAGEVSNVYKKKGKTRKIHNLFFLPDFESVHQLSQKLEQIGNLPADGRPTLGLSCRDFLEVLLEISPRTYLIPAHIWTPLFSALSPRSGFDSIEDCFEDLTDEIFALETGYSSDPLMNRQVSALDRFTLVSNSDAHSPNQLGRQGTILSGGMSYDHLRHTLEKSPAGAFLGTINSFPQMGRYYFDGLRSGEIFVSPQEYDQLGGKCPKSGKKMNRGVLHRLEELADRQCPPSDREEPTCHHIVDLTTILCESTGQSKTSRQVTSRYETLVRQLGPELNILLEAELEAIEKASSRMVAESIGRMRKGEVHFRPGYDGTPGEITFFSPEERLERSEQKTFFPLLDKDRPPTSPKSLYPLAHHDRTMGSHLTEKNQDIPEAIRPSGPTPDDLVQSLNPRQLEAVTREAGPLIIVAGPGTGKTRTLAHRIAYRILTGELSPENVLAVTLTDRAARKMGQFLQEELGPEQIASMTITTFAQFGLNLLLHEAGSLGHSDHILVLDNRQRRELLVIEAGELIRDLTPQEVDYLLHRIGRAKRDLVFPDELESPTDPLLQGAYRLYQQALNRINAFDQDDLLLWSTRLLEDMPEVRKRYQSQYQALFVDEYQDINFAQYRMIRLLAPHERSDLSVVGDPDQAIMGFRGSDFRYFLHFEQDYPRAHTIYLNFNYRSSKDIVKACYHVIGREDEVKVMTPEDGMDRSLFLYSAKKKAEENQFIAHTIESLVGEPNFGTSLSPSLAEGEDPLSSLGFSDMAVLYRREFQVPPLEKAFREVGVPYQKPTAGELRRYPDTQLILATLGILAAPQEDPDFRLLLKTAYPGKSDVVLSALKDYGQAKKISHYQALHDEEFIEFLHPPGQNILRDLRKKLEHLESLSRNGSVTTLIEAILKRFSFPQPGEKGASPGLSALADLAQHHRRIGDFLRQVVLLQDTDCYRSEVPRVTLMPMRAVKGLEFPVVFIPGCQEGIIPFLDENDPRPDRLEEECRLFYVSVSRAKNLVFFSHVQGRKGTPQEGPLSPFVQIISSDLIRKLPPWKKEEKAGDNQMSLF